MKLIQLSAIVVASVILCKIISLGIILLSMWIKGKTFDYKSDKWDEYLKSISDKKLLSMIFTVHLISAAIATFASYIALVKLDFQYAFIISIAFFTARTLLTYHNINKKGKDYIHQKLLEIRK